MPFLLEPQTEAELPSVTDLFDRRWRVILNTPPTQYLAMEHWLTHFTTGFVHVQFVIAVNVSGVWKQALYGGESRMFVGFENRDDALLFKIRFNDVHE